MMAWTEFSLAYVVFLASHSIMLRPAVKRPIVRSLGQRGFTIAYSLLSIAILGWLIMAAGRAPYVEIWPWDPWQNLVPVFGMAVAVAILSLSIGRSNPFSFGGNNACKFNPQEPGLVELTRHPILIALSIWAFTHLVPNGNLAHIVLFGGFGVFSLIGMGVIDRRKKRELGENHWTELLLSSKSSKYLLGMPHRQVMCRLTAGLILYICLLYSHGWLIGVSPLG